MHCCCDSLHTTGKDGFAILSSWRRHMSFFRHVTTPASPEVDAQDPPHSPVGKIFLAVLGEQELNSLSQFE